MIGYRTIGEDELEFLIDSDNPVYGKYKYSKLKECGCDLPYGVVCFYVDEVKWRDKSHKFDIKVNLPDDVHTGISTYMASKDFEKTKIFNGRSGKTKYSVKEAFVRFYEAKDIIELNVGPHYTDTHVNNYILPFCIKYNIILKRYSFDMGKEIVLYNGVTAENNDLK